MNIIKWLDTICDVPGYYILEMIKRDIEGMQQLNEHTSVKFIDSYHYRLPMESVSPAPIPQRYKTIRTKRHIQEWSYRGFKAMLWRIWGAILEGVPDHGFEFVSHKELDSPAAIPQYGHREFTMKEYGLMGREFFEPIRLVFFYDPLTDTLYTRSDFPRNWL